LRPAKDFLFFLWYSLQTMAYPHTPNLNFPFKEWKANSYKFKERCSYDGIFWGEHLGEDCNTKAGTIVKTIGRGKVVYSALHASKESTKQGGRRNWGNIIIIAHKHPTGKVFFSFYGHLGKRLVKKGDRVEEGQKIGRVAPAWSQSNGWWEDAHLHLAIYFGPWRGKVLPGYWKESDRKILLEDWVAPTKFILKYQ
jgi:murein DD-endopeptidase MepM/ murein hydrolase activator NlpD